MVGFHQFQQAPADLFGIVGKGYVHGSGISRDARPMALEGEQHAIGHPQGAENSPPGEQTYLAGSQYRIGCVADAVIVKDKTVEHPTILSRGYCQL